jgi:hypothetical protein
MFHSAGAVENGLARAAVDAAVRGVKRVLFVK